MTTPTQQLKDEHNGIKVMLTVLDEISNRLDADEDVNPRHLEQVVEFIQVFADKCHHAKEEDLLFQAMEDVGIPREGGPIAVMLHEHTEGRGYVKALKAAVDRYTQGDKRTRTDIVHNARAYTSLLRQHIDKEDNILYPMAETYLPKEKQRELLHEFDRIETERIGPGKHEEFHELLDHLSGIYLAGEAAHAHEASG